MGDRLTKPTYKFLFFLERDFHISLLKPLMLYIHANNIGKIKLYCPFHNNIHTLLQKEISIKLEVTQDPWSWKPDLTFLADFSYQYVEGLGRLVNIGHGTICKGWFYSKSRISQRENCADLLCVPGEIHKERLESQVYKPIVVTGMPKLDGCFTGRYNTQALKSKYGLNKENKTILLAPTFNEEFSLLPFLRNIDLTKIFPEYLNIIVKLHGVSDVSETRIFRDLQTANRSLYISDSYDTADLYSISDLLITDVSSVIYEFLSLGKPILLFDSPHQKQYINYTESDLEWEYRDIGFRFDNVAHLPSLIFRVLTMNQAPVKSVIGSKFISLQTGNSSEKVINSSLKLLESPRKSDLTILYRPDNLQVINRYGRNYPTQELPYSRLFQSIQQCLKSIETEYLLIFTENYELSPLYVGLLLNQIKNNPEAGVVVPLLIDNKLHLQQLSLHLNIPKETNFEHLGIQFSYSFIGQSKPLSNFVPISFIIEKDLFIGLHFTDITNDQLCLLELQAHILKRGKGIYLGYDCLLRKSEEIKKESEQEHGAYEYGIEMKKELESFEEKSEEELRELLAANPLNENIILRLLNHYYHKDNWEQIDVFSGMLPSNPLAIYYGLCSLEKQGFYLDALKRIESLNIEGSRDLQLTEDILLLKAKILIKIERGEEALEILNKVLSGSHVNIEALQTRGIYQLLANNIEIALEDFDKILNHQPQNIKALYSKGVCLQSMHRLQESSHFFIKVLELDAEHLSSLSGLLKNSWFLKNFSDVEKAMLSYLDFQPGSLDVLFSLSGVLYESQRYKEAREYVERILIFDENYEGASELLEKINCKL